MLNQIPSEDLIARYLAGEVTSQEASEVLEWAEESEENAKQLEEYRKTWKLSGNIPIADVNVDAAWLKVKVKIQDSNKTQVEQRKIIPIKPSGTSIFLRIAAGFIIVFGVASLLYYLNGADSLKTIVAENEAVKVYLPDSTFVLLEPHSVLSFDASEYGKSERKTDLKGVANYSVRKNADSPFIVNVGKAKVVVLGTSFRIHEGNKDESVEVAVVTGKVKLSSIKEPFGQNKTAEVILLPGMQGVLNGNSGEITVDTVAIETLRFKIHNTLVFEKTDLKEVCQTLSSVFGRNIKLDSVKLNNCMLTATFKNQKLSEILSIIASTFSLTIKEQANEFLLDGEGCL